MSIKYKKLVTKIDWSATLKAFDIDEKHKYAITNIRDVNKIRLVCVRLKQKGFLFKTETTEKNLIIKRVA